MPRAADKSVNIRDVARAAGVGVGTVSRVLNDGPHVSAAMRERVLSAIRQLGFRPNAQARRILRRHQGMVCFLLSNRDFLHSFHARILQGVETRASALKQHVTFSALHYSPRTASNQIQLPPILHERGWVDGVILAGTTYPNLLRRIQSIHIPLVAFGNNVVGLNGRFRVDEVCFDDAQSEFEATRYVIEQGHRRVAFVGDTSYDWIDRRYRGYSEAMKSCQLRPIAVCGSHKSAFREFGEWAAARIEACQRRPTAIVAANDEIAYGLWRSLRRQGLRVPDDVSLVGFDDREEALLMDPPLTTVAVHKEQIGQELMNLLLEKLRRPEARFNKQVLPTELVVRGTVKRLAAS
jgi:DNA-binding LacI/PurR family transcriptional regulator